MLLAQYNMSRLTDRLLKAGYVEREVCEDDGRGQVLFVTPEGKELLQTMWPAYRSAIQAHFANKLSAKDVENLTKILRKLT